MRFFIYFLTLFVIATIFGYEEVPEEEILLKGCSSGTSCNETLEGLIEAIEDIVPRNPTAATVTVNDLKSVLSKITSYALMKKKEAKVVVVYLFGDQTHHKTTLLSYLASIVGLEMNPDLGTCARTILSIEHKVGIEKVRYKVEYNGWKGQVNIDENKALNFEEFEKRLLEIKEFVNKVLKRQVDPDNDIKIVVETPTISTPVIFVDHAGTKPADLEDTRKILYRSIEENRNRFGNRGYFILTQRVDKSINDCSWCGDEKIDLTKIKKGHLFVAVTRMNGLHHSFWADAAIRNGLQGEKFTIGKDGKTIVTPLDILKIIQERYLSESIRQRIKKKNKPDRGSKKSSEEVFIETDRPVLPPGSQFFFLAGSDVHPVTMNSLPSQKEKWRAFLKSWKDHKEKMKRNILDEDRWGEMEISLRRMTAEEQKNFDELMDGDLLLKSLMPRIAMEGFDSLEKLVRNEIDDEVKKRIGYRGKYQSLVDDKFSPHRHLLDFFTEFVSYRKKASNGIPMRERDNNINFDQFEFRDVVSKLMDIDVIDEICEESWKDLDDIVFQNVGFNKISHLMERLGDQIIKILFSTKYVNITIGRLVDYGIPHSPDKAEQDWNPSILFLITQYLSEIFLEENGLAEYFSNMWSIGLFSQTYLSLNDLVSDEGKEKYLGLLDPSSITNLPDFIRRYSERYDKTVSLSYQYQETRDLIKDEFGTEWGKYSLFDLYEDVIYTTIEPFESNSQVKQSTGVYSASHSVSDDIMMVLTRYSFDEPFRKINEKIVWNVESYLHSRRNTLPMVIDFGPWIVGGVAKTRSVVEKFVDEMGNDDPLISLYYTEGKKSTSIDERFSTKKYFESITPLERAERIKTLIRLNKLSKGLDVLIAPSDPDKWRDFHHESLELLVKRHHDSIMFLLSLDLPRIMKFELKELHDDKNHKDEVAKIREMVVSLFLGYPLPYNAEERPEELDFLNIYNAVDLIYNKRDEIIDLDRSYSEMMKKTVSGASDYNDETEDRFKIITQFRALSENKIVRKIFFIVHSGQVHKAYRRIEELYEECIEGNPMAKKGKFSVQCQYQILKLLGDSRYDAVELNQERLEEAKVKVMKILESKRMMELLFDQIKKRSGEILIPQFGET